MAARCLGERARVSARPHPNALLHLDQVYKQIWKDVRKMRVLLAPQCHPGLHATTSSPFEAVDKMLPDRSIAPDKRIVHDQRGVNARTDKGLHPPAIQPRHEQIARLILRTKARYPGVPVLMAKKDIAGAFRLLWVDPADVELFAGDLFWDSERMEPSEDAGKPGDITAIYLVSSFGFSGSPGEWTVWGRATEEYLNSHVPANPRRDLGAPFESRILVDDNVLVEPAIGLRPWVAAETYERGVRLMLGDAAVNQDKDAIEGEFRDQQTVWGLTMVTWTEEVQLPERRVMKGAALLADQVFDYGSKDITLRALQRLRGVATGWSVIVKGLKNELKAVDRFLGTEKDGAAKIRPGRVQGEEGTDVDTAWNDLWEVLEACRWLCARPETWAAKFGADMRELLPLQERLSLPGWWQRTAVFVSSDATKTIIGAVDWTHGQSMRVEAERATVLVKSLESEGEAAIHDAEMLSFLAFACRVGHLWEGKAVER